MLRPPVVPPRLVEPELEVLELVPPLLELLGLPLPSASVVRQHAPSGLSKAAANESLAIVEEEENIKPILGPMPLG